VGSKARRALVALALAAIVFGGAWVRTAVALDDPGFDRTQPVGMLKSDPALLYYVTERVVEAEGLFPDDLRADPRVQHPRGTDLAAEFTVGQELLVGWTYPRLAFGAPLHVHAQRVMSLFASLIAVGVFLVARAVTGRAWPAVGAALLAALLPASYRTIGFVLVREDLSLPLFALGCGCAATAARAQGRAGAAWGLGAGLALALAAATWHAMAFVLALLALAVSIAYVTSGLRLADDRSGISFLLIVLAAAAVPALRESGFFTSPAVVALLGLPVAPSIERRYGLRGARGRAVAIVVAFGVFGLLLSTPRLAFGGGGAMSHVYEVVLAKLRFLGQRPADPNAISFDARLLWQGPFETLPLAWTWHYLGLALPLGAFCVWRLARRRPDPLEAVVLAFTLLSLPAAWFMLRLVVLPALALPVLAAMLVARAGRQPEAGPGLAPPRIGAVVLGLALVWQGARFAGFAAHHEISWYRPSGLAPELRALVTAVDERVPADGAILADFVNSTALLAHTRRPICLQPKYETDASRRDAEAFLTTFFRGTPAALETLMRERFDCRWLVVDRNVLGRDSRWTAGLAPGEEPAPGTAAARMLSRDADVLSSIPGFELVYRSPPTVLQRNGEPYDLYRLYRLVD